MIAEKKKSTWFSVSVTAVRQAEMAVETAFGILDAAGTEIDLLGTSGEPDIQIVGYFDSEPVRSDTERVIGESLTNFRLEKQAVRKIEYAAVIETDWLAEWKKHWKASEIGSFVVTPPWEKVAVGDDKIVISIEPSMAFGTGTHETTRLCLGLIEEYYRGPMSFLDVGTGTGILSIAAAKIAKNSSHTKIFACDLDSEAIKIASENAVSNDVPEIVFEIGSIGTGTPECDFVCANLTIDVILPMLPQLLDKSKRFLILSGILAEQEGLLRTALRSYRIENLHVVREGEWIAAVVRK